MRTARGFVIGVVGALALSACGGESTSSEGSAASQAQSTTASPTTKSEPKTLEAATAAMQEIADRFFSGDYAGAWDMYSERYQKGISRKDYERLGQTCVAPNGSGLDGTVKGVRMEGDEKALVRMEFLGVQQSYTMVYEKGAWRQEPTPETAKSLGKPVDQVIRERRASGTCNG